MPRQGLRKTAASMAREGITIASLKSRTTDQRGEEGRAEYVASDEAFAMDHQICRICVGAEHEAVAVHPNCQKEA